MDSKARDTPEGTGAGWRLDGGRVVLDPAARQLHVAGAPVKLGGRAFDLLVALVRHRSRVVPKQELLDLVWPGLVVEDNTLQVHVASLRRVLGPQAIATVSGRGYRCVLAAAPQPADESDGTDEPAGLIGRQSLLAEVAEALVDGSTRLLTLVGVGGAGKTRLALQASARHAALLRDGARTVMLAAVRDPAQVWTAIASVLELRESGAVPASELVLHHLQTRQMLLVLDNLEHLPDPGHWVQPLLKRAPGLALLLTSRMPTHLPGERVLRVPPLDLPVADTPGAWRASPAVQLFALRARRLGRKVMDQPDDLRAAAAVCRRLDGLPLAIELAAARLRVLTPAALADRLHHALPLLTGGSTEAPERHRTLRATAAWSHELLDPPAQRLFRRLSVFAGGWPLDGAEFVDDEPATVIDRLETLLDHSLVQRIDDLEGQPRYTMLETLREFAFEQLGLAGDIEAVRSRHAAYYSAMAQAVAPSVASASRKPGLARFRAELNNLRAALDWTVRQRADAATALPLVGALAWPWYFEGLYQEGRNWMREALALPVAADDAPARRARAAVLSGAARLAAYAGDVPMAFAHAEASVSLWRETGASSGLAFARFHEGIAAVMAMQLERAREALAESLALFHGLADGWGVALATSYLGTAWAVAQGGEDQARPLLLEGRARFIALGDDWGQTVSSHYLGSIALRCGDHDTAAALTLEMLDSARALGDRYRIARNLHQLAEIDIARGRTDDALRRLADSLLLNAEQQRLGDAALQLRLLVQLASQRGQAALAMAWSALSDAHADAVPTMPPDDPARHAATLAALRQALGPRLAADAWAGGRALSFDEVAASARALAGETPGSPGQLA